MRTPPRRLGPALLLAGLIALTACAPAPPLPPAPPAPPAAPAPPAPAASPVTWQIVHASGLSAPGGPLHLAPPYRFELLFSGPVNQGSVEAALRRNLNHGRLQVRQWSGPAHLYIAVDDVQAGDPAVVVDPSGGRDAEGRPLQVAPERFNFAGFQFSPTDPTAIIAIDPVSGVSQTMVRYDQPYQTVSLAPDRQRVLLRRHVLTPGQSVGITGPALTYDITSGRVEELDAGGLFEWGGRGDGGLLVYGGCSQGSWVVWVRPGPYAGGRGGAARRLYLAPPGEYVASAHVAPDGKTAAVFAGKWGEPLSLYLFDLTPERAGRRIATLEKVAGVTQGPSGLTSVPVAWSPDGLTLAFGDGGLRREEQTPMLVWLVAATGGTLRRLAEGATEVGPWSPGGDRLVLTGIGVVDGAGRVLLTAPEAYGAVWSPDGRSLYLGGSIYDTTTWQVRGRAGEGPAVWSPDGTTLAVGGQGGGLFRADGTRLAEGTWDRGAAAPCFTDDGSLVYLPNPDRVLEVASGKVYPLRLPDQDIEGLGHYRPIGFGADGRLLVALGSVFD